MQRLVLLVIVVTLLCALSAYAKRAGASRAGVRGSKSVSKRGDAVRSVARSGNKKGGAGSARARSAVYSDDDDDDDDVDGYDGDDYDYDYGRQRGGMRGTQGSRKGGARARSMRTQTALVRGKGGSSKGSRGGKRSKGRGRGRGAPSAAAALVEWGQAAMAQGPSIKERMDDIASKSTSVYLHAYRKAKVLRSSAFEGMLLKATWPADEPVPQKLLDEIIKYSIPAFKYGRSSDDDDPYHMTVHKLYMKMTERDWRTVTKAAFILHSISRDCSTDVCTRFSSAIKDMSRTREIKTQTRYFDGRTIRDLDESGEDYEGFVATYSSYVLQRAKFSTSKFDELKSLSPGSTAEKTAVSRMKKATKTLNLALKVPMAT